jgi:hypothetical protein
MTSHGYKQNEISQEPSMGTTIIKTSYYTVLRAFSLKKIKMTGHFKQAMLYGRHWTSDCRGGRLKTVFVSVCGNLSNLQHI